MAPDRASAEQQDARRGRALPMGAHAGPREDRAPPVRAASGIGATLERAGAGQRFARGIEERNFNGGNPVPGQADFLFAETAASRPDGDTGTRRAAREVS